MGNRRLKKIRLLPIYDVSADRVRTNTPMPPSLQRETDAMELQSDMVHLTQEQWLLMAREPVEVENWMQ